jgi:hypothetical protein
MLFRHVRPAFAGGRNEGLLTQLSIPFRDFIQQRGIQLGVRQAPLLVVA